MGPPKSAQGPSKRCLGPSQGVQGGTKRHRGGTEEAPSIDQGGTKYTPRDDLQFDMGPRADISKRFEEVLSNGSRVEV